jgi:hypothetical protein
MPDDPPTGSPSGPSAIDPPADPGEDVVFRRGKLRKRDDPAVDLFREAQANLGDLPRVRRILFELGRLYDPVTNGPILDLPSRRRVIELLEADAQENARAFLEQCVTAYLKPGGHTKP